MDRDRRGRGRERARARGTRASETRPPPATFGTGELILAAVHAGAEVVYVGVGGSATTDGGAGAIRAIREGGGLRGARLVVLCDVRTPFEDAARVFGPQKGAGEGEVRRPHRRLHRLARGFARDPRGVPMTGAAGGLSGGLWAEFGAELVPGAAYVLDAIDFDRRMRAARAVVTGEGKLDEQSLAGKAVAEVATRARQAGVPCYAVVGRSELDAFGARMLDLQAVLEAGTPAALERAGRELAVLVWPAALRAWLRSTKASAASSRCDLPMCRRASQRTLFECTWSILAPVVNHPVQDDLLRYVLTAIDRRR